ncbi:related to WD repeat-containing protein JIP5 [Saccharomycodes ludwigii]|uniref:WD repeat-containing protein JIP5 n=1 Tax=Saccharomycodes ludwigii TaxID=36035 RepID=A0A376BAF1_9ASCO|nr:related to WD repeat-containing protein JIP5 [Saccharomycodes ludwigii]
MGRKKNKTTNHSEVLPILELKYSDPLFDVKLHPSKPIIISSLATGYVTCHKYDPKQLTSFMQSVKRKREKYTEFAGETATGATSVNTNNVLCKVFTVDPRGNDSSNATSFLTLMWKTRRHKGSVRSMCVDENGDYVYTIGSDNILKKANTMDGKVVKKINLLTLLSDDHSKDESTVLKITKLVKSAKQPLLILGDESGNVYVLSSKDLSLQNTIHNIHNGDAINDLIPFAKRSVYKYISLGQTTLAYWDSRKSKDKDGESKITVSDDQEDEILCGTFVNPENGEVLVCGMGEGILTIWKPNKNQLQDQLSRIKICKNQSIDSVVPTLQDDNCVWCGCSDGNVYKVNIKTI